jgi:heptosyltransferase-3
MRRLLIRPGAIGDCLCSLPVLYLLQGDETEVWTNGAVVPLVQHATRCRSLASTGFSLLGIPSTDPPPDLLNTLRSFDEILSWSGHNQPLLVERAQHFGLPIHFFPPLPDAQGGIHVADFLIAQTTSWHGLQSEPEDWQQPGGRRFLLRLPEESVAMAATKPIVVLHPFSGSPTKNWPLDHFRKLAQQLASHCQVQWCAGPEDPLPADLRPHAWQFEELSTLAAHLRHAALYVGNDSGITHLAAELGVPVLAIFGPMDPRVWAPRGTVSRIAQPSISGRPASEVSYDLVASMAQELLLNHDLLCQ